MSTVSRQKCISHLAPPELVAPLGTVDTMTDTDERYTDIIRKITGDLEHDRPILHDIADAMHEKDEHHSEYAAMQYALLQINGETFGRTAGEKQRKAVAGEHGCTCTDERTMTDISEVEGITILQCDDCQSFVHRHLLAVARQNTSEKTSKDNAPITINTGHSIAESTVLDLLTQIDDGELTINTARLDKPSGMLFAPERLTLSQ